jgi:hypothetical protein
MNEQMRTNDKGWSPAWGLGVGLTTSHSKKEACYETIKRASDLEVYQVEEDDFGVACGANGSEEEHI